MENTVILPEQNLTFLPSGVEGLSLWQVMPASVFLTAGKSYLVVWGGVEYECKAAAGNFNGFDGVGIGNFALAGLGENTNEPFLFGTATNGSFSACYSMDSNTTVNVAIYKIAEEDKDYLIRGSTLTAIADAIRSKTGSDAPIAVTDMAAQIANISAGGGGSCADVRYVTFMNGDVELGKKAVAVGDDCADPIARGIFATPTRESSTGYDYTFAGWATTVNGGLNPDALKSVTEDRTVYANFIATARLYTITFYDDDGVTVLATKQVAYGTVPSHTPTKAGAVFSAWTPTPVAVTGDASYTAVWTSVVASGAFSTGLTWNLFTDGTMKIAGSGAMPDWTGSTTAAAGYKKSPIYTYASQIKKVVIENGVTHIGNFAFYTDYTNITSVELADSVVSIGSSAFKKTGVKNITIPNSVTLIGDNAFDSCAKLTSVTLPNSLVSLQYGVFLGCGSLNSIVIPATVTYIGYNAFYNSGLSGGAVFENPVGWWVTSSASATSGDAVDVSDPTTAATYLKATHARKYWHRS